MSDEQVTATPQGAAPQPQNVVHLFSCGKCGNGHSRFRGRLSGSPASYCLKCHAEYMRINRPKHSELSALQKEKANARSYANSYQSRGILTPMGCEVCGSVAEKHHEDYSRPLDVKWLCKEHHIDLHMEAAYG